MQLEKIAPFRNELINVIIETPRGSRHKYTYEPELDMFQLKKTLPLGSSFPFDFGFIPNTHAEDGDPLDVLVLLDVTLFPGVMVNVRPVGVLKMKDEAGGDDKLVAVLTKDPRWSHIQDLDDIPEYTKKEIEHFFEHYKDLEPNKWVKVDQWGGKDEADRLLAESIVRFAEHEGQTKTQGEGEAPKTV